MTICVLALCSLLLVKAGPIKAAEPGYTRIDYNPNNAITIDGKWTNDTEWTLNGEPTLIGTSVVFRSVWEFVSMSEVYDTWLVEFLDDTTNDVGDYWQMCIDGDQSGGTVPQTGDYRIDIVNHTNLIVYQGNGTGWTVATPPASIVWANSLSASPTNSTPHWILELRFNKPDVGAGITWNFRLAAYDKTTDKLVAWPPTPRDEPARWGVQNYVSGVIPETLSIAVVVLLLSTAAVVSFYFLRKRPKIESVASIKTGGQTHSCM